MGKDSIKSKPHSSVCTWCQNDIKERANWASLGREFHGRGATKKALPLGTPDVQP